MATVIVTTVYPLVARLVEVGFAFSIVLNFIRLHVVILRILVIFHLLMTIFFPQHIRDFQLTLQTLVEGRTAGCAKVVGRKPTIPTLVCRKSRIDW